ncbi:hypothetical protein GCM10022407_06670 [Hymenobacter antarcticus]|uniref:Por secretion system C-terminal sorting domain-containing protein n=1 Tax=Hymenobacter antarcticus TaxID=486270 RepID=A0ABP7PAT5_9BACT
MLVLLGLAGSGQAQEACMLIPTPLAERVATATLIVEAGVRTQQAVSENGHIYTISELTVYKVFRGTEPVLLRLAEAGGTVGLRREVVSTSITLAPEQQGLFLLEPNPLLPGTFRLVAGPQGFVRYDLADRTAVEPFGRYASITGALYPAVVALAGQAWRAVRPNAALAGALPVARPTAQPVISSFAPASLTAGTESVLTINGSNFGTARGSGRVEFPNANNGGGGSAGANPTDYVSWSDTQIQVRVPSLVIATGEVAGTGNFRVINDAIETGISPASLTVTYALSNVTQTGSDTPTRPKLVNDDTQGGYTLRYSPSLTAVAAAPASFERALASWACATPLRRVVGAAAAPEATAGDNVNVVRFGTLGGSTLAAATSYYSGCFVGSLVQFSLVETDYTFSDAISWHYGTGTPPAGQFDFESVALHELGHGTQLNHIIMPTAVMHFAIAPTAVKRTLSTNSDIAAGQDVFAFSATNPCTGFLPPTAAPTPSGCGPLPVELTAFSARYVTGSGTSLAWSTATERNSAYFAMEAQEQGDKSWTEVLRQPAAGSSSRPRSYEARDPRLLSGIRYYRLRQGDRDGSTSYSGLLAVSGLETGLALYPNPVADRLQVSGPAQAGRLTFYDVLGQAVARFELVAGPNDIDVSGLRTGLYQVEWADGRTVRRGRLQKL